MKQPLMGALLLLALTGCGSGGGASYQPTAVDSATNGLYKVRPRAQQPVVAQQPSTTRANNLNPVAPRPEQPMALPHFRPLLAGEGAQVAKQLNQQRLALNATGAKLRQDTLQLRAQLASSLSAKEQAHYQQRLAGQRQQAIEFLRRRNAYQQNMAAFQSGRRLLMPDEARRLDVVK